eukprot:16019176-Heterocapsa_arctica.AAC.1
MEREVLDMKEAEDNEIYFKDLRNEHAQYELTVPNLVVTYHEIVSDTSNAMCPVKLPNKHNHIYLLAKPMSNERHENIEEGKLGPKVEPKKRAKGLRE